jgi:hypothetical protein
VGAPAASFDRISSVDEVAAAACGTKLLPSVAPQSRIRAANLWHLNISILPSLVASWGQAKQTQRT